jgi:DNA-binding transcriptional ArsR family regulator
MSHRLSNSHAARRKAHATVFAALGDETRLAILARLSDGKRSSISQLTEGNRMSRQAVTKHLRVMQRAGIVHAVREGRESLFALDPQPIEEIRKYLGLVSEQWDQALTRLKSFVESDS